MLFLLARMVFAVCFITILLPVKIFAKHPDLTGGYEKKVDHILVVKHQRKMFLMSEGAVVRQYNVAVGRGDNKTKVKAGDHRTPEGIYRIIGRNPQSQFYKSLKISYPNETDRAMARFLGKNPGDLIMIHGQSALSKKWGKDHYVIDWTKGCIAVTNSEMDEIWTLVKDGTVIEIKP